MELLRRLVKRVLVKRFEAWRDHAAEERTVRRNILKVITRLTRGALVEGMQRWRFYVDEEKALMSKEMKVECRAMKGALAKCFEFWRCHKKSIKLIATSWRRNLLGLKKAACRANAQNQVFWLKIEKRLQRNLQRHTFNCWLMTMVEREETDMAEMEVASGNGGALIVAMKGGCLRCIPYWYSESIITVTQQRMISSSRFIRAWSGLIEDRRNTLTGFHLRRQENLLRLSMVRWKNLTIIASVQQFMISSAKVVRAWSGRIENGREKASAFQEGCLRRKGQFNLLRHATRMWMYYTYKSCNLAVVRNFAYPS
jgi:hypothetical protein